MLFNSSDFQLHPDELERWFMKIDHIFEHTRVPPIGEVLAPFYRTSVDKGQRHHLPTISHINYKYRPFYLSLNEIVYFSYASSWDDCIFLPLVQFFCSCHKNG